MDLGPVDSRLLPLLRLAEPWVVVAEAEAPAASGAPALLAHGPDGAVLAGVELPGGAWLDLELNVVTDAGVRCVGRIDRVAEAAWVLGEAPAPGARCQDPGACPAEAAAAAWEEPTGHLIVGHLAGSLRCAGDHAWARAAGAGPLEPVWARPAPEDALVNLAIASFRRLPAWSSIQARWLREAQPLDATEWDTAGGKAPEVALFQLRGVAPLYSVAADLGERCAPGFAAELSAVFERRDMAGVTELVPLPGELPSTPGFAPTLVDLADGLLRFAAPMQVGGPLGVLGIDARPRGAGGCR